ncbi:MAG: hypothetical protein U9O41_05700 [Candidatus Aerophobetes bacterium]|nr:hypothetical protein [Candidatus Aerophobetes bacterium]
MAITVAWPRKQEDLDQRERYGADKHEFENFMLEKPEPVKGELGYTTHKLGVKGTLRRKELYKDR